MKIFTRAKVYHQTFVLVQKKSMNLHLVRLESTAAIKATEKDLFLNNYKKLISENKLRVDAHQLKSVIKLNNFYNKAIDYEINKRSFKLANFSLFDIFTKKQNNELDAPKLQGVYLYGGVGKRF